MARTIFHVSDYPDLVRVLAVRESQIDEVDDLEDVFIHAPCCGRTVIAGAVADVRNVRGTVVRGGGIRPAADLGWLCDGCRARLFADPTKRREVNGGRIQWTESGLLEARGAPAQMVHWHQAAEWEDEMRTQAFRRGEEFKPVEARAMVEEQIVALHRRRMEADAFTE